jgi:hypothetical protein
MDMQTIARRLSVWATVVGLLLLVPLVLTIRNRGVDGAGANWTVFDFVTMGTLLFGAGVVYELVAKMGDVTYRSAVGLAVATSVLLVWINGAVGIIGGGDLTSANGMYFGVLVVGAIGALLAHFRPRGMARALFAMAVAQALVPVIALLIGTTDFAPGVVPVFALNAMFVMLFVGSAMLFRRAGGRRPELPLNEQ